jgi:metallo-beta-lactamase family protein
MCTAGRIKHHLKHNIWRPGASIVIVGFQAQGTTGRRIVDGEKSVKIFREDVAVKAKVFTIGGFSAHADQKDLLEWVGHFAESKPQVFVIHGEPTASEALARSIHESFGMEVHVPRWKENLMLKGREVAQEVKREEAAPPDRAGSMLSKVIDLEHELGRLRQLLQERGGDMEIGQDVLDRLRSIQEELREILPGQIS